MMVFEVSLASKDRGLFRPVFVCDFCLAPMKGGGDVLFPEVEVPAGIAIGSCFQANIQAYHLHENCLSAFVQARVDERGADFSYRKIPLSSYIACILANLIPSDKGRQRIWQVVEEAVEAEGRP